MSIKYFHVIALIALSITICLYIECSEINHDPVKSELTLNMSFEKKKCQVVIQTIKERTFAICNN